MARYPADGQPDRDPVDAEVVPLFTPKVQSCVVEWLRGHPQEARTVTEIRLRAGLPVCIRYSGSDALLDGTNGSPKAFVSLEDIQKTLSFVSDCSYYALESEFANGYITIPGGHRVGLSGQVAVWPDGSVRIREVSGMSFRIARAIPGVGESVAAKLAGSTGRLPSTLIISPPGGGKTTLLRDLCRIAGEGLPSSGIAPGEVGVVDERSEIAACYMGIPQHDLGPRVSVLDRCPKAKGMIMLIRSMSPDVVATDEIGSEEDSIAVANALSAGASVLATCHGESADHVRRRPASSWLLSKGYFERIVVLSRRLGPGTVEYVGEPP